MATTGNNAKQQSKVAGNPRVAERAAEASIRLVPDLAPANLISELNAGLDYYVANVQSAITEELEKLINSKIKIGVYPISELSWQDTGDWTSFNKLMK